MRSTKEFLAQTTSGQSIRDRPTRPRFRHWAEVLKRRFEGANTHAEAGKLAKRLVDGDLSPATDEMRSVAIACAVAGAEGRSR